MKLRCRPEDFVVEELPTVEPAGHGPFTLYRMTKTGLGTLEAVEAIRHRWQIDGSRISYGFRGSAGRSRTSSPPSGGQRRGSWSTRMSAASLNGSG